jgi:hypothetical protein
MVRKGTNLHKVQQKIFKEAFDAERYLNVMSGHISKYDSTMISSESINISMMCIITEMGWISDYKRYCENEKSLTAQALSI